MSTISSVSSVDSGLYAQGALVQGSTQKAPDTEKEVKTEKIEKNENGGVVYEASSKNDAKSPDKSAGIYSGADKSQLIAKLKADAEERNASLRSLVEKMMLGQNKAYTIAGNDEDSMWKFLAEGKFEVDPETKRQAQEDISEDGYWGVEKTSDRIVDFAKALAGNDAGKAQELLDAFKKGYEQAEKTWGKELPEISKKTFEATERKFNEWMNEGAKKTEDAEAVAVGANLNIQS